MQTICISAKKTNVFPLKFLKLQLQISKRKIVNVSVLFVIPIVWAGYHPYQLTPPRNSFSAFPIKGIYSLA